MSSLPLSPIEFRVPAWAGPTLVSGLSIGLAAALLFLPGDLPLTFGAAAVLLLILISLHARFLHIRQFRMSEMTFALNGRDEEFRSLFAGSTDALLVLNDQMICQEANHAAARLLRTERSRLEGCSFEGFLGSKCNLDLKDCLTRDRIQEPIELTLSDGVTLIAELRATSTTLADRHLIVLRDRIKQVREQASPSANLAIARAALNEAAIRERVDPILTATLPLDSALESILEAARPVLPFERAQVLLLETPARLFCACELGHDGRNHSSPLTLDLGQFPLLARVVRDQKPAFVQSTSKESGWRDLVHGAEDGWLGVPLEQDDKCIGLLSFYAAFDRLGPEHLRIAEVLASSVAIAVRNARLEERAEIFRAELARYTRQGGVASESNLLREAFRATPVATSLSTWEGDFVGVSRSFEDLLGYRSADLIERDGSETALWADAEQRASILDKLLRGQPASAAATLRRGDGEQLLVHVSAERLSLTGQSYLVLVLAEPPRIASSWN